MSGISLTASMRSNLLSLQNISGQVSSTQNKLATGNKVNSAIDNPSSYYTALSLNNRADDLNALLDSMGQAVSTIKAATTALESATEFLEQASAVATQALESAKIPSKSFFEEKVGENGAVVTTAQELRDAVNSGKETICVYGAIDLDDISQTGGLTLQENQKLVGVGYFGNYDTDTNKFSSITATADVANKNVISITQNNNIISDLSIDYTNSAQTGWVDAIRIEGSRTRCILKNLDMSVSYSDDNTTQKNAIYSSGDQVLFDGQIRIRMQGRSINGIYGYYSTLNIPSQTNINIQASGASIKGITSAYNSVLNISGQTSIKANGLSCAGISADHGSVINIEEAKINLLVNGDGSHGITTYGGDIDIKQASVINIQAKGANSYGFLSRSESYVNINYGANIYIKSEGYSFFTDRQGPFDISGNICIESSKGAFYNNNWSLGTSTYIRSTAQIYISGTNNYFVNNRDTGQGPNILEIDTGAKLAFEKDGKTNWYEVKEKYHDENTSNTIDNKITADDVKDKLNLETTSAWELPEKVEIDFEDGNSNGETAKQDLTDAGKNYQEIINQYDSLIKDANYKGINLLQNDKLSAKFNEDSTASLNVQGKDMSSQALGFTVFGWQTQGDIADSLAEIASALKSIRNYSAELGNNYSIITTRQDFTESLINVLTEGADKLTLADMNEESANMLALQTRQQLAINSLSLASQASQSILKLF